MADFKKPTPTPADNHAWPILILLFGIYVFYIIIIRINEYLSYSNDVSLSELWAKFVLYFLEHIMPIIEIVGVVVVILTTVGIIYNLKKLNKIREEERLVFGLAEDLVGNEKDMIVLNEKWVSVVKHINSISPSDWKLAIIEADIMLDELLKVSGYHGDSLGEMLKSVEKSDFLTIESAWEAHKIRNQIAHEGSDFLLNEREAKRVISLYEGVFKEFEII